MNDRDQTDRWKTLGITKCMYVSISVGILVNAFFQHMGKWSKTAMKGISRKTYTCIHIFICENDGLRTYP